MKQGTLYASRLKKAFAKTRKESDGVVIPEADDPMRRLAIGVLGVADGEQQAERCVDRLLSQTVDWNEIRVSSPSEVHKALGASPSIGPEGAERLITVLQSVFDRENDMSLERLRNLGRREARQFLDSLNGVDVFASASVLLWSLGGHAIPVDDRLLASFRQAELVNPNADRAEVQAFIERHVSAAQAKEFCLVMRSFGRAKRSSDAARKSASKAKTTSKKKRAPKRVASE